MIFTRLKFNMKIDWIALLNLFIRRRFNSSKLARENQYDRMFYSLFHYKMVNYAEINDFVTKEWKRTVNELRVKIVTCSRWLSNLYTDSTLNKYLQRVHFQIRLHFNFYQISLILQVVGSKSFQKYTHNNTFVESCHKRFEYFHGRGKSGLRKIQIYNPSSIRYLIIELLS